MAKITLSIPGNLLRNSQRSAKAQNISLNALVCRLLEQTVGNLSEDWLESLFVLADQAGGNSRGKSWRRSDLYK